MEKQIRKYSFILFAPVFAAFLLVFIIPFILGIYLSFTEFTTVSDAVFVGLKNYAEVFKNSGDFLNSLWFTVKFAVVSVVSINIFAFFQLDEPFIRPDIRGFMDHHISSFAAGFQRVRDVRTGFDQIRTVADDDPGQAFAACLVKNFSLDLRRRECPRQHTA
jgi:hypothetical protein